MSPSFFIYEYSEENIRLYRLCALGIPVFGKYAERRVRKAARAFPCKNMMQGWKNCDAKKVQSFCAARILCETAGDEEAKLQ